MARKKTVTLQHLADHLGLTTHTVSKALRGLPGMSLETRQEVIDTAKQLGYRTKAQNYSLAIEKIPNISKNQRRFVLILRLRQGHHLQIIELLIESLQERLAELEHKLEILIIPASVVDEASLEQWLEQCQLSYTDGMFISPAVPSFIEKRLLEMSLHKIMINFPPPDAQVDSVIWDVYNAVFQSVRYFVSMGHRKIMYIGAIERVRGYRLRWQAFNEAMKEAGLTIEPRHHFVDQYGPKDEWLSQFIRLFTEYEPTALLCAINQDLAWVYYACSHLGKRIPEHVSLISLETEEHDFIQQLSRPQLMVKETGYRAVDRMLWRIANPHLPYEHIRLQGGFHPGKTVAALLAKDSRETAP